MSKKYQLIYADPPWSYNDKSKNRGGAESHYKTMSMDEIASLPIDKISADDSVLFLWTTYPQLFEAKKIIEAWGFEYSTGGFTWVKTNKDGTIFMGMGHTTRANAELCLFAKKGKGLKRQDAGIYNTQLHRIESHSKKPDKFRSDIVRLYGDVRRIELFARKPKQLPMFKETDPFLGWDTWGNETDSDIELKIV